MTTTTLAAESSAGNPILNISIFALFLIVTMAVVLRAGKTTCLLYTSPSPRDS